MKEKIEEFLLFILASLIIAIFLGLTIVITIKMANLCEFLMVCWNFPFTLSLIICIFIWMLWVLGVGCFPVYKIKEMAEAEENDK